MTLLYTRYALFVYVCVCKFV